MDWLPKKTVVVPVDFSNSSLNAVRTSLSMVSNPEDVHVIHVLEPMPIMEPGVVWGDVTDESRIRNVTESLRTRLKDIDAIGAIGIEVRIGSPGVEIVNYAKGVNAELIVIASHGRTGLKHLLLGSVAERVARHALCPVLILRHKKE